MKNKKILLLCFILVAMAQLYVPANMIFEQEKLIDTGKKFKFRSAPVDPYDAFRGKYIVLSFSNRIYRYTGSQTWEYGEPVFISLGVDGQGYSEITGISREKPEGPDYVCATISSFNWNGNEQEIFVDFPFDRFYMEEFKAAPAETIYRESIVDTTSVTWAEVMVKDGDAMVRDVMVDGVSIRELAKAQAAGPGVSKN